VLPNSTIGVTGIMEIPDDNGLAQVRRLLLIELKKGSFKITNEEWFQTFKYMGDLLHSNLGNDVRIAGYVVGDSYENTLSLRTTVGDDQGVLYVTTYSQLVDTAERRMFNLRNILAKRYEDVPGMELYARVQMTMKNSNG
jgi:hypothetical protein